MRKPHFFLLCISSLLLVVSMSASASPTASDPTVDRFFLVDETSDAVGAQKHPALERLLALWSAPSQSMPASFAVTSTMMILDREYASDAPRGGVRPPAKQVYRIDFAPPITQGDDLAWDLKVFRVHSQATSSDVVRRPSSEEFEAAYTLSLQRVDTPSYSGHRLTDVVRR